MSVRLGRGSSHATAVSSSTTRAARTRKAPPDRQVIVQVTSMMLVKSRGSELSPSKVCSSYFPSHVIL